MIEFVTPNETSFKELDKYARVEEVNEVLASHNSSIYHAAKKSCRDSTYAYAVQDRSRDCLLAIFGVHPKTLLSLVAVPWLLTTVHLREDPRPLLKYTKKMIELWLEEWPVLENFVDARYEESVRWAKWSGFEVEDPLPYGYAQLPFHRIVIRRT